MRQGLLPTDLPGYLLLSLLVIAWCAVHSAMISVSVTECLRKRLGPCFRFYRLFFNLFAIASLAFVAVFAYSVQTEVLFSWSGYWRLGQVFLIGGAVLLFFLGMRHYDAFQFLGIKQIREGSYGTAITSTGTLDTSGILAVTRHPWYLATLFLVWGRSMDASTICVNVIISAYLVAGIYLEEKKLIREFGEQYLAYRQRVSTLIPFRWLKMKIFGAHGSWHH